jgi:hypothetical protein
MRTPPTIELLCPSCGHGLACLRRNGPHIEARCAGCSRHVKFVSRRQYGHLLPQEEPPGAGSPELPLCT